MSERRGLAAVGITEVELARWRNLAAMLTTLLEELGQPWASVGGTLTRLLDAVDALTSDEPRKSENETDACLRAIGLVSRQSDEQKLAFASALVRQLAQDLSARQGRTPTELVVQMAHRALGVALVGPGEVAPSETNGVKQQMGRTPKGSLGAGGRDE